MAERGASCNSFGRGLWTSCCAIIWVLTVIGCFLGTVAVKNLIGPIKDLPASLQEGFYQELGFDGLKSDSAKVKTAAEAALTACGATPADCPSPPPSAVPQNDTSAERLEIQGALNSSLSKIEKVATDPYLGIEKLNSTAEQIRRISEQLESLDTTQCDVTNAAYCEIYEAADGLVAGAQDALDAIDELINSEGVQQFEEHSDRLALLYVMPYLLLVSLLFFSCFWKKDAAWCCCGGSIVGCLVWALHLAFWLASLIINFVIVGVAWQWKFKQDKITMGPPFKGNPTLAELLSHIETTYPSFWAMVVVPLEDPLNQLYVSSFVLLAACILLGFYGLCLPVCRPYTDKTTA
jgi:hypothetical protein